MTFSPAITAELRPMLRLAAPLVAGQVLLFGTNVVDALLAGHLGPLVLGAVAIGGQVWMFLLMAMQGVMFAVPARVSEMVGAGQRAQVGFVFRQALWLAFTFGVAILLVQLLLSRALVDWLQLDPVLGDGVVDFLRSVGFGAPALGVFMACRGLSDGLSLTKPAMWFGLLSLLSLIPIGYGFMYGAFGHAGLGALGSGLATACVIWLQAIGFAIFVASAPAYRGIGWASGRMGPDWRAIGRLLQLGLPMAATVLLEVGMFSAAGIAVARFGAVAVAAHQIALNVGGLAFMMPLGLSAAITVRVGMALGAGSMARARLAGLIGIGLAVATQSVTCLIMSTVPGQIAALYTEDPAVRAMTTSLLAFAAWFQFSDGAQVTANGALRGLQDTRFPAAITLLAYWGVGMPVGLLLAFHQGMGPRGMWAGLLCGLTVAAVLLGWRFLRRTLAASQRTDRISA